MKSVLILFILMLIVASCSPKEPVKVRKTELDSLQIQQLYEIESKIKEPLYTTTKSRRLLFDLDSWSIRWRSVWLKGKFIYQSSL